LLVTKNIDKIEKDITLKLTEITKLDKTYFNRTTWYKIVKVLAHLRYLPLHFAEKDPQSMNTNFNSRSSIDSSATVFKNIFLFILEA